MTTCNTFSSTISAKSSFGTRSLLLALAFCITTGSASAQARVSGISVTQYSRVDTNGITLFANSSLASIYFNAKPDIERTYYLNMVAKDAAGKNVWVVKNYPIFSQLDNYSAGGRQLELDFKNLGYRPGDKVASLKMVTSLSLTLAAIAPTGTFASIAVVPGIFSNESVGYYNEATSFAGFMGMVAPADVKIHNDGFPSVQEGKDRCTRGAFARSIAWLNTKYGLGCTLTAQEIYQKMLALNTGTNYDTTVARKARFLDSLARAGGKTGKTEFMDKGNKLGPIATAVTTTGTIGDVVVQQNGRMEADAALATTVTAGGGPLGEIPSSDPAGWLKDNLAGNDVELHFDNHMITVTGITCTGGKCTITYRDDEHQGDDSKGDSGEKTAEIDGDSIKVNGKKYKIEVLFKESVAAASRLAASTEQAVELLPNKPNPFNQNTIIGIQVRKALVYETAELVIRDMQGGLVQRIALKLQPGLNEVQFNTRRGERGGLVYTLEIDGRPIQSRQMYVK